MDDVPIHIKILDTQGAHQIYMERRGKGPVRIMYKDHRAKCIPAPIAEVRKVGPVWELIPIGWELKEPITGTTSVKCAEAAILPFHYSGFKPKLELGEDSWVQRAKEEEKRKQDE